MKKISTFLLYSALLVFGISTVTAQEKCKYIRKGNDPISGKPFQVVGAYFCHPNLILDLYDEWIVNMTRSGDEFYLDSKCEMTGTFNDKMVKGDSLILKLDNGKFITLYAATLLEPIQHFNKNYYTGYGSNYPMKIEDVELLSSVKVVFAQIHIGPRVRNENIKDKDAIILQKAASCLLK
jgi:hypothetical protein